MKILAAIALYVHIEGSKEYWAKLCNIYVHPRMLWLGVICKVGYGIIFFSILFHILVSFLFSFICFQKKLFLYFVLAPPSLLVDILIFCGPNTYPKLTPILTMFWVLFPTLFLFLILNLIFRYDFWSGRSCLIGSEEGSFPFWSKLKWFSCSFFV